MKRRYTQSIITTGRFTLPVVVLITIVYWVVAYLFVPEAPESDTVHALWIQVNAYPIPFWFNTLACLLIYFGIGYLLIQLNNAFSLIRIRASVQTSVFLLLIAACPTIQYLGPGNIATLLFVVTLYLLFSAYQCARASGYLFHAFIFVGLGSLVFPQITFLVPVLLIGASNFQALDIRSLLAALLGWSFPYWFLFGYAYYHNDMEAFYQPFIELATFYPIDFSTLSLWELAVLGYSFVMFMISAIHCFIQSHKDRIRTRVHLRFLILLTFCIYILIALQPIHFVNLLPLSLVGVSILTSHLFVLTGNKISNIFFILSTLTLLGLFFFNLWTLL